MLSIASRMLDAMLVARTDYTPATSILHKLPHVLGSFGQRDTQTTEGPFWFLTRVNGEDTGNWHPRVFAHYRQEFREKAGLTGLPHPLTEAEEQFVGALVHPLRWYPSDLEMGHAVWWRNQKWACPILVFYYSPEDTACKHHTLQAEQSADRLVLRAFVESEAERLFRALQSLDGATVLLDLDCHSDRYLLYLLVPLRVLRSTYTSATWQSFLFTLFAQEPGALPPGTPVFIDDVFFNHDQHDPGCECGTCNSSGKAFGCRYYDLSSAPVFLHGDDVWEWLNTQDGVGVVWAASEDAALHNARLACERMGYDPMDPFTRVPIPREHHILRF